MEALFLHGVFFHGRIGFMDRVQALGFFDMAERERRMSE
jgi:hypothetical protein